MKRMGAMCRLSCLKPTYDGVLKASPCGKGKPMRYRRVRQNGGTYFFTVVTNKRKKILCEKSSVDLLRDAFRIVKDKHPFTIDAMVVLPDHLHCMWTLPENDDDYPVRWRLIKSYFTRNGTWDSPWQNRFWEHVIRDDKDYANHMAYIHINPVKHGHVPAPVEWEHSSFHRYVKMGWFDTDWGSKRIFWMDDIMTWDLD